jgi:hypothetical protein
VSQASLCSLHAPIVQLNKLAHERALPTHKPPTHLSPTVQYKSSLQDSFSALAVQSSKLSSGEHFWQGLSGFGAFAGTHAPLIKQPKLTTGSHCVVSLQT